MFVKQTPCAGKNIQQENKTLAQKLKNGLNRKGWILKKNGLKISGFKMHASMANFQG